jgi:hypothetical protein
MKPAHLMLVTTILLVLAVLLVPVTYVTARGASKQVPIVYCVIDSSDLRWINL